VYKKQASVSLEYNFLREKDARAIWTELLLDRKMILHWKLKLRLYFLKISKKSLAVISRANYLYNHHISFLSCDIGLVGSL